MSYLKRMVLFISVNFYAANINAAELSAVIDTNYGEMSFELFADQTPVTVSNFVTLSREEFYNGLTFHRIIKNFMIQGGDPKGSGSGGPGYCFKDEFQSKLKHSKIGTLSMANAGPNTNGSQFFITLKATPHLDNRHTVFGQIISGHDVLEKIAEVKKKGTKPLQPVIIKSVKINGKIRLSKVVKQFEADKPTLDKIVTPKVKILVSSYTKLEKLGKLSEINIKLVRTSCSEAQIVYKAKTTQGKEIDVNLAGKFIKPMFKINLLQVSLKKK